MSKKNRKIELAAQARAEKRAKLALDRKPAGTIDLAFSDAGELAHVNDPIFEDISSLAVIGHSIFCTCDETATIERVLLDPETFEAARHRNFALGEIFDLPGGTDGEMDIEGLSISGGFLWVCGSHSLKRDDPGDDGLKDMEDIDWDPNRGFLGRVPLIDRGDGVFDPVGVIEPVAGDKRRAAMLPMQGGPKGVLRKMLAKDPLIGPFIGHPCKENGFDIEGLAVRGDTVLLGLRGPVLGSFAFVVRLEMKATKDVLKPRKLKGGGRYALHALDLNGQGIRDLTWDGDRLLVLSGATTDLEALQSVFALEEFDPERRVYGSDALGRVLDLPVIRGSDHAEGIAACEIEGARRLMVAYDSPHGQRTDAASQRLTVDLFALGGAAKRRKTR